MDRVALKSAAEKVGVDLSSEQLDQFEAFENALYEANKVMNLTRVPQEECWQRHFLDSILFCDQLVQGEKLLDIGTGPGFPSWPIALARPDIEVFAIDSGGKMLGFLQRHPLPNLQTELGRAEDRPFFEKFDVVTGRALAPLPIQLEISSRPCKVNGRIIPMRTPNEPPAHSASWKLGLKREGILVRELGTTGIMRAFPSYRKVKQTPVEYPRQWNAIKANPL